jgi:hypothetical protein
MCKELQKFKQFIKYKQLFTVENIKYMIDNNYNNFKKLLKKYPYMFEYTDKHIFYLHQLIYDNNKYIYTICKYISNPNLLDKNKISLLDSATNNNNYKLCKILLKRLNIKLIKKNISNLNDKLIKYIIKHNIFDLDTLQTMNNNNIINNYLKIINNYFKCVDSVKCKYYDININKLLHLYRYTKNLRFVSFQSTNYHNIIGSYAPNIVTFKATKMYIGNISIGGDDAIYNPYLQHIIKN